MKNLICIDSSTHQASIALFQHGRFVCEEISLIQRSHSEFMTVALEKICLIANLSPRDIDGIAVTQGPGSFTGIRVAIGVAKTLSFSNQIPIWTINTLDLLRTRVPPKESCFVALNAYKNLVFGSFFEKNQKSSIPEVLSYESAARIIRENSKKYPVLLIGEGTDLFSDLISAELDSRTAVRTEGEQLPRAKWLGELVLNSPESGQTLDWKLVNPLYLRGSEAEENLKIHSSENT